MNDLLLVVDVQNGFVSERTKHIVPLLQNLLTSGRFRHVVFSQFENMDSSPYEVLLGWHRLKSLEERKIVKELEPYAKDILKKTVYSSVNDFLKEYIKKNNITTVYIAGIDTDCCVLTSAVDIFQIGVRPVVLSEYCASNGGMDSHTAALRVLGRLIGEKQIVSKAAGI